MVLAVVRSALEARPRAAVLDSLKVLVAGARRGAEAKVWMGAECTIERACGDSTREARRAGRPSSAIMRMEDRMVFMIIQASHCLRGCVG